MTFKYDIEEMKQMELSVSAISEVTGYDRKTVRKYLMSPEGVPQYGQRPQASVCNAAALLQELRQRSYSGGYTILTDWRWPQHEKPRPVAVRRFETPPGRQTGFGTASF